MQPSAVQSSSLRVSEWRRHQQHSGSQTSWCLQQPPCPLHAQQADRSPPAASGRRHMPTHPRSTFPPATEPFHIPQSSHLDCSLQLCNCHLCGCQSSTAIKCTVARKLPGVHSSRHGLGTHSRQLCPLQQLLADIASVHGPVRHIPRPNAGAAKSAVGVVVDIPPCPGGP